MTNLKTGSLPPRTSCLPDFISLDVFKQIGGAPHSFSHRLKSVNAAGPFLTPATLDGHLDDNKLDLVFRFRSDGVSLPYNIYALLVVQGAQAIVWHDFTEGCSSPGRSIFPGQELSLPQIKLAGDESTHIIVWGKL